MKPMTTEEIRRIVRLHGIRYRAPKDKNPLVVKTTMAKVFPISRKAAFEAFSDPVAHVGLFEIIKGSTKPIRKGIEPLLKPNQFLAFEHVQESSLPPRLMVMKYTLDPPRSISKEGVTDPFLESDVHIEDRKKALVRMDFTSVAAKQTEIKTTSTFTTSTGAIFSRGFIDRVWLNFFERMMVASGMITKTEMQT